LEQRDAYVRAYVPPHACAVMPWGGGLMYSELGVGWCSYDASTGLPPGLEVGGLEV
jgi:hypothetical protein